LLQRLEQGIQTRLAQVEIDSDVEEEYGEIVWKLKTKYSRVQD